MSSIQKFVFIFILLSHAVCSRRRNRRHNSCLFNVFSKFYISDTVYFDLSRFASTEDSWNVSYSHDNYSEANLKFTFCQEPSGNLLCGDESVYACVSTETKYVVKNAGSRISGPFYRNGELQISVDNGESFGDIKFSVLVKLNCSDMEEKPTFLSYHDYVVTLLWNIPVGCPIDENDTHNTCVKTSPKGVTYNLRPLRHKVYYKYSDDFRVNICGKKKKDECNTVCKYNDNGTIFYYGSTSQIALTGPEDSDLKINYLDASDDIYAEVHLKCDRSSDSYIDHITVSGHVYVYMNSIFACEPQHPRTVFQDDAENSYNISSLYHNAHNYRLKGPTEGLYYIFNLGGAVDHIPGITCEGIICLWDSHNNLSVSLGYAQLEPIATEDSIHLHFTGGGKCGAGSNVHQAVIKLQCSDPGKDPEFEFITHDCVHYIMWDTLSACSYKYFKGRECIINDKSYNYFYNLNRLYNKTHNYIAASPTNEKYLINICGSIIGNCGSYESGVSVCWHNKALGHINTEPIFYNGDIEQKMTGEACRRNGPNSTVTIKFLCELDEHAEDHNKIELKHKDEFNCIFVFVMYTSDVCISSFTKYSCMITDYKLGCEYNFKKLSRTNSNYVVKTTTKGSNATFLLNVCQPVIPGPNVMCQHDVMACLFTRQNAEYNRYMSIGKMSIHSFQFNKEHRVELRYTQGALCADGSAGASYETSTVIEFFCDYNAENSEPIFNSEHKCEYRFTWFTPVVCAPVSHKPIQQTSEIHEASKEKSVSKDIQDHHLIKTEEKENKTPLELIFDSGKSKTIVASSEKEHMESSYAYEESVPEDSVDYTSHSLKLKNISDCSVIDNQGERIDLSLLMQRSWHVRMPSARIMTFSVCHNLTFVNCNDRGHAGACMNQTNIGVANNKLIYQPGQHGLPGKVFLNYTDGDVCRSYHKYSTLLSFECGTVKTLPKFVTETDTCEIVIRFVTPLVCVMSCMANSTDMQISIDMSVFASDTHNYYVKSGEDEFFINVCRPLVVTGDRSQWPIGSAACKLRKTNPEYPNHMSLGFVNSSLPLIVDKAGSVWLRYVGGVRCETNLYNFSSAVIHFICNTTEPYGSPTFRNVTTNCEYYFDWHTSIVCPNRTDVFDSDMCLIHDIKFTSIMNLTVFKNTRYQVISLAGSVYMLELCGNFTKICDNRHTCHKSEHGYLYLDYGNAPITTYDYARNAVHIMYLGGNCSLNARFHASIWLKCNRTQNSSIPSIIMETECTVVFEWESKHFCYYPNKTTLLMVSGEIKENGSAGLLWIIIGLFVLCIIAYAFGLWMMDRKNSRICDLLRHCCTSTPPTTSIRYSRDSEDRTSIL